MIKLRLKKKLSPKLKMRLKRKMRARGPLTSDGTQSIPRVCVNKSNKYIYAQVVDDASGKIITNANSLQKGVKESSKSNKTVEVAKKVGKLLAEKAKAKGVETVKFDRNGYPYKGRVKALADAAREAGLKF